MCCVSRHICRLPSRKLHFVKVRQTSSAHARHETRQGKARHRQVRREGREREEEGGAAVNWELSLAVWALLACLTVCLPCAALAWNIFRVQMQAEAEEGEEGREEGLEEVSKHWGHAYYLLLTFLCRKRKRKTWQLWLVNDLRQRQPSCCRHSSLIGISGAWQTQPQAAHFKYLNLIKWGRGRGYCTLLCCLVHCWNCEAAQARRQSKAISMTRCCSQRNEATPAYYSDESPITHCPVWQCPPLPLFTYAPLSSSCPRTWRTKLLSSCLGTVALADCTRTDRQCDVPTIY